MNDKKITELPLISIEDMTGDMYVLLASENKNHVVSLEALITYFQPMVLDIIVNSEDIRNYLQDTITSSGKVLEQENNARFLTRSQYIALNKRHEITDPSKIKNTLRSDVKSISDFKIPGVSESNKGLLQLNEISVILGPDSINFMEASPLVDYIKEFNVIPLGFDRDNISIDNAIILDDNTIIYFDDNEEITLISNVVDIIEEPSAVTETSTTEVIVEEVVEQPAIIEEKPEEVAVLTEEPTTELVDQNLPIDEVLDIINNADKIDFIDETINTSTDIQGEVLVTEEVVSQEEPLVEQPVVTEEILQINEDPIVDVIAQEPSEIAIVGTEEVVVDSAVDEVIAPLEEAPESQPIITEEVITEPVVVEVVDTIVNEEQTITQEEVGSVLDVLNKPNTVSEPSVEQPIIEETPVEIIETNVFSDTVNETPITQETVLTSEGVFVDETIQEPVLAQEPVVNAGVTEEAPVSVGSETVTPVAETTLQDVVLPTEETPIVTDTVVEQPIVVEEVVQPTEPTVTTESVPVEDILVVATIDERNSLNPDYDIKVKVLDVSGDPNVTVNIPTTYMYNLNNGMWINLDTAVTSV
jgi:hypothetical protein